MAFAVDQIDHVEVFVRDMEASIDWYARVLGLGVLRRWNPQPVMIGVGDTNLALFLADAEASAPLAGVDKTSLRWRRVAWRTSEKGFVAAREHLKACQIEFIGPVDHDIARSIYFEDLDGHPLEITYYYES